MESGVDTKTNTFNTEAVATIHRRNEFYRKKFHFALGLLVLSLIGIIVLSFMLRYLVKHPPHPLYFVANPVGQLIPETSVTEPIMSLQDVQAWVMEAVQNSYSMDYINYRAQLQNAQKYFTDYGWRKYMQGLSASNNLVAVTKRHYIQIATVTALPKLVGEGTVGGAHGWKFQMPLYVLDWGPPYDDSPASKNLNALVVTVLVQRQSLLTSYRGLGIVQFIAQVATQPQQPQNLNPNQG